MPHGGVDEGRVRHLPHAPTAHHPLLLRVLGRAPVGSHCRQGWPDSLVRLSAATLVYSCKVFLRTSALCVCFCLQLYTIPWRCPLQFYFMYSCFIDFKQLEKCICYAGSSIAASFFSFSLCWHSLIPGFAFFFSVDQIETRVRKVRSPSVFVERCSWAQSRVNFSFGLDHAWAVDLTFYTCHGISFPVNLCVFCVEYRLC